VQIGTLVVDEDFEKAADREVGRAHSCKVTNQK
jgi:hypothetical protein